MKSSNRNKTGRPGWRCDQAVKGLATAIGIAGCVAPMDVEMLGGENRDRRDALFQRPQILHIDLEIPEMGIEILRGYRWQWNPEEGQKRQKVRAVVREGGEVFRDVSVHLKGAAGSFRTIDEQPSFTLKFDRHIAGQRFHGMDKLSLNNSVQDPSLCHEWLARNLFLAAGIPVPRVSHARVTLNGRELGLYLLVEGFDRGFLRGHFENVEGNLYDGGFVQDIDAPLGVNSGTNPSDHAALDLLRGIIRDTGSPVAHEQLEEVLDVDRFLSHLAVDVLLVNWDGYHLNRNNYRLFHDQSRDKFVFMPHGLDQLFEYSESPIFPFYQGQVTRAVMNHAQWQDQYISLLRSLMAELFDSDGLIEQVRRMAAVIRSDLVLHEPNAIESFEGEISDLERRIQSRHQSLQHQLDGLSQAFVFEEDVDRPLRDWQPDPYFGKPVLDAGELDDRETLRLSTEGGPSVGRWRKTVWLRAGQYELSGAIKLSAVQASPGDSRGGMALWSSAQRVRERLTGDQEWAERPIQFSVRQPVQRVELYCEYRATSGTAWVDRNSLRLRRLQDSPSNSDRD